MMYHVEKLWLLTSTTDSSILKIAAQQYNNTSTTASTSNINVLKLTLLVTE